MGFRTVEISRACEIHIKEGRLEISSDEGTVLIPIEDLSTEFHRQPSILAGDVLTYAIPATLLFFTENGPEYQSYQGPAVKHLIADCHRKILYPCLDPGSKCFCFFE